MNTRAGHATAGESLYMCGSADIYEHMWCKGIMIFNIRMLKLFFSPHHDVFARCLLI